MQFSEIMLVQCMGYIAPLYLKVAIGQRLPHELSLHESRQECILREVGA